MKWDTFEADATAHEDEERQKEKERDRGKGVCPKESHMAFEKELENSRGPGRGR